MTFLLTLAVLAAAPAQAPQAQAAPPPQQQQAPAQQAQAPQAPPQGPAMCVKRALAETGLDAHESVLLCQSANSAAPVDCFVQTRNGTFLEKNDILTLCSPTLSGAALSPYSLIR